MNLFSLLGIQDAHAETSNSLSGALNSLTASGHAGPPTPPGGSIMSLLPTLVIFALVFYFLLIRPQSKRAKEHRKLMDSITAGDEVVTTGGLVGKVVRVVDQYVVIGVNDHTEVTFQKASVAMVLPKGSLKAME